MPTYDETAALDAGATLATADAIGPTYRWFSGAETGLLAEFPSTVGSPTIVTAPVRTGRFALKVPSGSAAGATSTSVTKEKPQLVPTGVTGYLRGYVYVPGPVADPALVWENQGYVTQIPTFRLFLNPNGTLSFAFYSETMLATGTQTIRYNRWNQIEMKCVTHASTGGVEVILNNVVTITSFAHDTEPTWDTMGRWAFGPRTGGSQTMYFDDLAIGTGRYLGPGAVYSGRGDVGITPTYADWALANGAGSVAIAWSDDDPVLFALDIAPTEDDRETMGVEGVVGLPGAYTTSPLIRGHLPAETRVNAAIIRAVVAASNLDTAGASIVEAFDLMSRAGGAELFFNVSISPDASVPLGFAGGDPLPGEVWTIDTPFQIALAALPTWEVGGRTTDVDFVPYIDEMWAQVDVLTPPILGENGTWAAQARVRFLATIVPAAGIAVDPFLILVTEVIV